ncbi:MAG TPA: hypothetical protein VKB46_08440, partial [Pyrinomonadaceae bacterium]|nr:hypothetical protein [Pyrinomonadaceae bacterium]
HSTARLPPMTNPPLQLIAFFPIVVFSLTAATFAKDTALENSTNGSWWIVQVRPTKSSHTELPFHKLL